MRFSILFKVFAVFLIVVLPAGNEAQTPAEVFASTTDPAPWLIENFHVLRASNSDTALHYINRALERTSNQAYKAKLYQLRGITQFHLGNFDAELESHQRGLRIAQEIGRQDLEGQIWLELSMGANRQKELSKSIDYAYKAIALCENADDKDCQASARRNLGRTYLKTEHRDSAIHFLTTSLAIRRELKDTIGISYGLNDMSQLALEAGETNKALRYLEESSDLRRAKRDSSGLAINLNNIGEVYLTDGRNDQARTYLEQSLAISRAVGFSDLQRHTLGLLGGLYEDQGDYKAALANLAESKMLQDSLYSLEKARAISELEVSYETAEKERTIQIQAAELRQQRLIALAVALSLLLLAALVYFRIYQKRRYERQLAALELREELLGERYRISRDLHDSIGANLTRIITDLDLMKIDASPLPASISEQLTDTRQFTRGTIGMLRDTIWALNQEEYRMADLVGKIRSFLKRYLGGRLNWTVSSHMQNDRLLSSEEVLNLLRILQEASQNTLKHAGAKNFEVAIEAKERLHIRIYDDGCGFDQNDETANENYGLKNMKERMLQIGGELSIETSPGNGTRLNMIL